jgi:hypothetical protein
MTEPSRCPYCGYPGESPLGLLYQEVARIRDIAERGSAAGSARPAPPATEPGDQSARSAARIAELTREVDELRATVARLRGCAVSGLARSG